MRYIDMVRDVYDRTGTKVRGPVWYTDYSVEIGLNHGSALSQFLFAVILDELSNSIQKTVPW